MEMAQEQMQALANLATATKSNREAFMNLTSTNETFTAKLLGMQITQGKTAAENATLKIAAAKCRCRGNRNIPRYAP